MAISSYDTHPDSPGRRRSAYDQSGEIARPVPPRAAELTDWMDEMMSLLGGDEFRVDR